MSRKLKELQDRQWRMMVGCWVFLAAFPFCVYFLFQWVIKS